MPFPRQHLLVSPVGDAWGQVETWTFGLRVDRVTMPNGTEMTALEAAYRTFHQSNVANFSNSIRLLGVKVAPIGPDGRYPAGENAVEKVSTTPVTGVATSGAIIPQQSVVVSLRTSLSRGRGNRGRVYMPPSFVNVNQDGYTGETQAMNMATTFSTLLGAIRDALGANVVVGSPLAETLRPVTRVEVGTVVDTQRRRRGQLQEEYYGVAVNPLA